MGRTAESTREWKGMRPRQKARLFATFQNGTIRNGSIFAPDGVDVSHRMKLVARTTLAQARYAKNRADMGRFADENGGFVNAYYAPCVTLEQQYPTLSQSDVGRLMFLATYTAYNGTLQHDNGRIIDRSGVEELVGLSRSRFSEFYGKLLSEGVLCELEGGRIRVNPALFNRGKREDVGEGMQSIRLYRDTIRSLYAKFGQGRDVKQLSIVFMVIPFLNFRYNIVAMNPKEYFDYDVVPMTLDQLALVLQYSDASKLKRAMSKVRLDDQPVFAFVEDTEDRRKRRIIANPRVLFAGDAKSLRELEALAVVFNSTRRRS